MGNGYVMIDGSVNPSPSPAKLYKEMTYPHSHYGKIINKPNLLISTSQMIIKFCQN